MKSIPIHTIAMIAAALWSTCLAGDTVLAQSPRPLPPIEAEEPLTASTDPMLALLQQRVAQDPTRADCWRLIGRIYKEQGRIEEALSALRRCLDLQEDNAAAHFDYGELMLELGDRQAAGHHHQQVMLLAPESNYAATLTERGFRKPDILLPPLVSAQASPSDRDPIALTGYEIQTFDGADDLDRRINQLASDATPPPKRWRTFVEFGTLYNTNVALTPISRELTGNETASFQAVLTPEIEWSAIKNDFVRGGPLVRGYFAVNEEEFEALNLASFSPGMFVERSFGSIDDTLWIGRADYVYSLDLLGGDRFGDRHAITTSLTTVLPSADVIYLYFTTSLSDFADDGANPAVDSLDGLTLTAGASRFFQTGLPVMPAFSLGADVESAETDGADFRYTSTGIHGDVTFQLTERLKFVPRAGVGYRWYDDFTGPVNRDELTYRIGGKLRWQCTTGFSISLVSGYDRFASDNADFDTERFESGIVATFLR